MIITNSNECVSIVSISMLHILPSPLRGVPKRDGMYVYTIKYFTFLFLYNINIKPNYLLS